jgi:excinuclease UvrABC ATPase subunit
MPQGTESILVFIRNISATICETCNGFGHTKIDMQYSKKGHKKYCPTAKYIDAAYQNCTDKVKYKELL